MIVSESKFRILEAFMENTNEGFAPTTLAMYTHEIREWIDKDPHPTLGRMIEAGMIWKVFDGLYGMTELGEGVFYVGALERGALKDAK